MSTPDLPHDAPAAATRLQADDWQALPLRARTMFTIADVGGFLVPALVSFVPIGLFVRPMTLAAALAVSLLVALPLLGAWLARKRYRHTYWKLDTIGFAFRRGRLWRLETCVPTSRVQHVDLRHGPLERRFRLATLVVHTAGTRDHAMTVTGLDETDAERLRDHLASQVDDEGGDADVRQPHDRHVASDAPK
jgi:uncharacterized protein